MVLVLRCDARHPHELEPSRPAISSTWSYITQRLKLGSPTMVRVGRRRWDHWLLVARLRLVWGTTTAVGLFLLSGNNHGLTGPREAVMKRSCFLMFLDCNREFCALTALATPKRVDDTSFWDYEPTIQLRDSICCVHLCKYRRYRIFLNC